MQVDDFLALNQDKFDLITEIQDLIYGIDDSNLEEFTEELNDIINENPFLDSQEGLTFLLKILKFVMISRPFFNESHFSLISSLKDKIQKWFSSDELYASFSFRFFNLKLYELGIIDFSSIFKNSEKDVMTFFYFSPEIQEHCPKQYEQKLSNDNWLKKKIYSIGGYQHLSKNKRTRKNLFIDEIEKSNNNTYENEKLNEINDKINPLNISTAFTSKTDNDIENLNSNSDLSSINNISDEEKARLMKFKEIREVGFNEMKIAKAIREDNLNETQLIISKTNLDLETVIPRSFFERSNFINDNNPTLIEYAAFCGSIDVFKFLINLIYERDNRIISEVQNNACLKNTNDLNVQSFRDYAKTLLEKSERLCKYAIAGGCYDIIHVIEDKKYLDFYINSKLSLNGDPINNTNRQNLFFGLKFNFNELFNISIQFHRNEIYDYLAENCYNNFYEDVLEKNQDNILIENFNSSILYYNFEIFLKLLPIVANNNLLNSHDSDGETPLHVAAINGHIDIVKLLCSIKGIDINSRANNLETPLQWAISYDHINVVKYMLDLDGIDYSGENKVGIFLVFFYFTSLFYAANIGNIEIVKLLLDKGGYDYDCKNNDSVKGSQKMNHGIDINHVNMYNEFLSFSLMTALHYAVRRNHIELVKFLCSLKDIDLTIVNLRGQSILDIAAFHQYSTIVEYLKSLGIEALLDSKKVEEEETPSASIQIV